ncbi:Flavin carrier protein 2 [Mycena sanguinolenta]|uniref:Flavin carrier protein 2 n=1 Tax=Mycena sanguinolenta TaxID=230812 RepID=A0A8H6ZFQ2_9AGAR|nr:Flavin carrier protein 2 [Mycena sanguinolenta]
MLCRNLFKRVAHPCTRHVASKPAAQFPFPNLPNPTPHQVASKLTAQFPFTHPVFTDFSSSPACIAIGSESTMWVLNSSSFHLIQRNVDFDLVRIYHPDKVDQSVPSRVAHARFQAITAAYNALRTNSSTSLPGHDKADAPTPAARAMYKRSRNLYSGPQLADESWKDRVIVAGIIFVRVFSWRISAYLCSLKAAFCFVVQAAVARRAVLQDAISQPWNAAPPSSKAKPSNTAPSVDPRLAEPDPS